MVFKQKLIKRLKKRVGTQNVELFSSCRNAIFCLIKMLDFKKEDEVIVQSFICDTIPQTVNEAGATAIAVDVDESTYNLSAEKIKKHHKKHHQKQKGHGEQSCSSSNPTARARARIPLGRVPRTARA